MFIFHETTCREYDGGEVEDDEGMAYVPVIMHRRII